MYKIAKKIFLTLTIFGISVLAAQAQGVVATGQAGDNITWTLTVDSVLTFSGSGPMTDLYNGENYGYNIYYNMIEYITIEEGITSIGRCAFSSIHGVEEIIVPSTITHIGDSAFCWNYSGQGFDSYIIFLPEEAPPQLLWSVCGNPKIIVPCGSELSYQNSFANTTLINYDSQIFECNGQNVYYKYNPQDASTLVIGYNPNFVGVLIVPESVITCDETMKNIVGIGGGFGNGLTSIYISDKILIIENNAFNNAHNLTDIIVDENNPKYSSIDGVLYNKNQDTLIQYPIGKQGALTIPNSVISINHYALYSDNIEEITCLAINPPSGYFSFPSSIYGIPVHIPCLTESLYLSAYPWYKFTNYTDCITLDSVVAYTPVFVNSDTTGLLLTAPYGFNSYDWYVRPWNIWNPTDFVNIADTTTPIYSTTGNPADNTVYFTWQELETNGYYYFCRMGYITDGSKSVIYVYKDIDVSEWQVNIENNVINNFSIFPNPTNESFFIEYDGFISIKLYDILGKEVLNKNTNGKTEININHLQKGIYYIQIFSNEKIIGSNKIVKQ